MEISTPDFPSIRDALSFLANPPPGQLNITTIESFLLSHQRQDPCNFVLELSSILTDESTNHSLSYAALIFIGSTLRRYPRLRSIWPKIDSEQRQSIHLIFLSFLKHPTAKFRQNAAFCLAALIGIEFRSNLWPDFFDVLFETVTNPLNGEPMVESCLHLIQQLFDQNFFIANPTALPSPLPIFEVLRDYLNAEQTPDSVRFQSLSAFRSGLPAFDQIFDNSDNFDRIIIIFILNLSLSNPEIRTKVFDVLTPFCVRHFLRLTSVHMGQIFEATICGVRDKFIPALSFWTAFAGASRDHRVQDHVRTAASAIFPFLLQNLLDETIYDENCENPVQHSVLCLMFFVNAGGPSIISPILAFIDSNLSSEIATNRTAALFAIGATVEIADFYPILVERFPIVISLAGNPAYPSVQEAALFIIRESLKNFPQLLASPSHCISLLELVLHNLEQPIDVVRRSFEMMFSLFNQFNCAERQSFLAVQADRIWGLFEQVLHRPGIRNLLFLHAVFESLNAFLSHLPLECAQLLFRVLELVIDGIHLEMHSQDGSSDYVAILCSVITTIAKRLQSDISPYLDRIMAEMLIALNNRAFEVYEEVFPVIAILAIIFKQQFCPFHDRLTGYVIDVFHTENSRIICQAAQLIEALFDYPTEWILQFTEELYDILRDAAESPNHPKEMKPIIVNGLIAVTAKVSRKFEERGIELISLLGRMQREPIIQPDDAEYGYLVFEAVLSGYVLVLEILEKSLHFEKDFVMRNIKQFVGAIQLVLRYSFVSVRVMDLALKLIWQLLQVGRYDFAERIPGSELGRTFEELFGIIRESEHPGLLSRLETLNAEIKFCLRRGF
jgi:hypothetical protein